MSSPSKKFPALRIAIQKSGRLGEESLQLLEKAGFKIPTTSRDLLARATNFPLEILFLRVGDIQGVVSEGLADVGIVGENSLEEEEVQNIEVVEKLGFGKCKLCLAVPENSEIFSGEDFSGKVVATTYKQITKKFFAGKNIPAEVVHMSGSVEIAPRLGIADGICDIVSTGNTLVANKLRIVEKVFESEAILITRKNHAEILKEKNFSDVLLRIRSVLNAKNLKSVVMNAPENAVEKISKILPGLESPTIMPLAKKGWIALHSVVPEDEKFWERIDALQQAGAKGILISTLDRVIF